MINKKTSIVLFVLFISIPLANNSNSQIIEDDPAQLRGIDIEEHLHDIIPLDFTFTDDEGDSVQLGEYFNNGKPVIIILGYYACPMLCNLVMNGVSEVVNESSLKFGEDYQIVSVSIDPRETEVLAAAKKKNYLNNIDDVKDTGSWDYLTGKEDQSKALADAIGFKYYYDEEKDLYAHAAVLTVLTEQGKISRYLYGIKYEKRDFRMAIIEASQGKVGNTIDRIILYCYRYDPDAGGYVIFAGNLMRLSGAITLGILASFLGLLWFRERRKKTSLSISSGIKETRAK